MSRRGTVRPDDQPQLGLLFEESVLEISVSTPPRRPARATRDTLPGWARRAMAAAPPVIDPEPEPETVELEEPARRVFRVVELLGHLRSHMEEAYADVWVRGEISNMRAAPSGHLYFTLKDDTAALAAVMFAKEARKLRWTPEDGHEVLLNGRFSLYELRGQIQLIAEYLEPVGAGSLQIAYEQLKHRLEAEGLFAMDRKQPLPAYPRCVGIVTSPGGAVIRDFLNVANRRHAALDVLLYPATVQGATAAEEVAAGVAYFNVARNVDVIVIARGGGSLEDLQPFNSEHLARAIAASALPVVSAVGHETDFAIADFVADLRAPTPSAAAELITAAQHRVEEYVEALSARLGRAAKLALSMAHRQLASLGAEAGFARVPGALQRREQRLDELRFRMEKAGASAVQTAAARLQAAQAALLRQDAAHRVSLMRERFAALDLRLTRAALEEFGDCRDRAARPMDALAKYDLAQPLRLAQTRLTDLRKRLDRAHTACLRTARHTLETRTRALAALSPLAVLNRGYALVYRDDGGSLLTEAAGVPEGAGIRVRLAHGSLGATVTSVKTEGA